MANDLNNLNEFSARAFASSDQNRKAEPDVSSGGEMSGRESDATGASSRLPAISLPKGGGAIRGIGEKFAANPVSGTGSFSIPIAMSTGRSGFGPQLSLSYDSGAGNGAFGFGWHISLPTITRKTDKGLPQYHDDAQSDVFILSGAEDLVPLLKENGGDWQRDLHIRKLPDGEYEVQRYRPRVEGLFARIERWYQRQTGEIHWRSITRDNVTTIYGKNNNSRILDPRAAPAGEPPRIFSWLVCETYDDRGNAAVYEYKAEDSAEIDLAQAHEANRNAEKRAANRYLKRIKYGNLTSRLVQPDLRQMEWLFEVVLDYGEHDQDRPSPQEARGWLCRHDPFSSYRAGFEVRSYRLCQRVLIFHHFPDEEDVGRNCLVRSTDFAYRNSRNYAADVRQGHPIASFLASVTQSGYKRQPGGDYLKQSLPPLEFTYSEAVIQEEIREIDLASLENVPYGLDGTKYEWVDLDGEGVSGILTEQANSWFYKANLGNGRFGPLEQVPVRPSLAGLSTGRQQLIDLAGEGQLDLVQFSGATPGFYERTEQQTWEQFKPFSTLPNVRWDDPNLRFVDLTGDGHADVLVTEDDVLTWYPSLAEAGFASAQHVYQTLEQERHVRAVFADGTQSLYLADMSGDGLPDLVRVRNGEVCYWPNLGYGRFGAKVTMDHAPWLDQQEQFEQGRVRLADIDGSGASDLIYLGRDGVRIYFNQAGNGWSEPHCLQQFPRVDNLSAVAAIDLLGNGTACLVWSSTLPGDSRRPMRYIDLMGGQKPHLLVRSVNNLGAETHVSYTSCAKFHRADKLQGKPWITKVPFPVHVVERVETYDRISRNRFVTRYTYHHGFYDGVEREFRGFGMVEQFDTEEFAAISASEAFPVGDNIAADSHVPPVLTRTWFHTGVYLGHAHVSDFFAGLLDQRDLGEYYREPGLSDAQARALLLDDTVLPAGLTLEEEREACRALKGAMLRQEIYALDGSDKEPHPYTVTEQSFTIRLLQPQGINPHAVFFTHNRESLGYQYERNATDPRVSHTLTLAVDEFGNVLKSASVAYGRRKPSPLLERNGQARQSESWVTYTEEQFTNSVDSDNDYRTPLPFESRVFELTGVSLADHRNHFDLTELLNVGASADFVDYEMTPIAGAKQKRLIEHVRTLYSRDDFVGALALGELESKGLPFESYKLAFTPGLLEQVYAGRVNDQMLIEGGYVHTSGESTWWIPAGQVFYSPDPADPPLSAWNYARAHFFLPQRFRDPFHTELFNTETVVIYDRYDLLAQETVDPLGNRMTIGERQVDNNQPLVRHGHDYRVLKPKLLMDPNRNQSVAVFDALGSVVGTAVMGKPEDSPRQGDSLEDFEPDLTDEVIAAHLRDPLDDPHEILGKASTRILYDLFRYYRTRHDEIAQPVVVYNLVRETHDANLLPGEQTPVQHSFVYSDGFGREIQTKIQGGPKQDFNAGDISPILTVKNQSEIAGSKPNARWVGSGWRVFNNKGKPVRQFEPFFSDTHLFEFDLRIGVSPVLCYDPVGRPVVTLRPNHTWEKVVFDAWAQKIWDVSDTILLDDPKTDSDVGDFFRRIDDSEYLPTWYTQRRDGALGPEEQVASLKAAAHAATPTVLHFDSLARPILTVAHNKLRRSEGAAFGSPAEEFLHSRVSFDMEGNQRQVRDALDRLTARYDYDILGTRIHQSSMEAGERWILKDVAGYPLYAWDSRNHQFHSAYDQLHRPISSYLREGDGPEIMIGQTVYGDSQPDAETGNLRLKVVERYDQAGGLISDEYDFRGNLLRSIRQLAREYKATLDWSTAPPLEEVTYTSRTRYDALNRPTELITPDNSVIRPEYNEASQLKRVAINLRGATPETLFVAALDYDSKGQRTLIVYGNGVCTTYEYDPLTFLLRDLCTTRNRSSSTESGDESVSQPPSTCDLQSLHYTYDPVGNVTHIRDEAQQSIYFRNQRVEPSASYTYDALYRLIEATGREHLGQTADPSTVGATSDASRVRLDHPCDGKAMGQYVEEYFHNAAGDILEVVHRSTDRAHSTLTRKYDYNEPSQLEPHKTNNRLSSTTFGSVTEIYRYEGSAGLHGNITSMPHLPMIQWDYHDQLRASTQQVVNNGGTPETTWYVYDASGRRVRKLTEHQADAGKDPIRKSERIYLAGLEIYREYENDGTTVKLERETLHAMDEKQRIALVETRTDRKVDSDVPLIRYQLANHLGSATLELDQAAQIISYEEYYPYGSTSYQAVRSQTESPKRYRYTGKERDEESALYYGGARYYAPWLGRWVSCDPTGIGDGTNLYAYVKNNPLIYTDPSGTQCDPTTQSCVDPTLPTAREEALQQSLPEEERYLPLTSEAEADTTVPTPSPCHGDNVSIHWQLGPRGERIPTEGYTGGPLRAVGGYTKPLARMHAEQGNYEAAELAEHYMCPSCHVLTQVNPRDFNLRGYVTSYEEGYKTGAIIMGSAAFAIALPEVAAMVAAYSTGVSITETATGKSSGIQPLNLLTGNIDTGRQMSTGERVFSGVNAGIGLFTMGMSMRTPRPPGGSLGGPGGGGGGGGTTRLWRAVEPEELADVLRYGDYNIHPNSTFKRFAFDEASLDSFIRANPTRNYTKTYIDVPTENLGQMFRHADPGGVGRSIGIDVYENPQFYDWFDRVQVR